MRSIVAASRSISVVIILTLLFSGALVQAQDLKPKKNWVYSIVQVWYDSDLLAISWHQIEGAVASEIWIKGPDKWRPNRNGGWRKAHYLDAVDLFAYQFHGINGFEPGKTYTFRIRYIDADGNKGPASKPFKHKMLPCWVFHRFWETHEINENHVWPKAVRYKDLEGDEHGPVPAEWKMKNTRRCKGVKFQDK